MEKPKNRVGEFVRKFIRRKGCKAGLFVLSMIFTGCTLRLARDINLPTAESGATVASNANTASPVTLTPSSKTLIVGNSFSFEASGGVPPYTYSVISGSGSVAPTTGSYTAPSVSGSAVIQAADSLGQSASAQVTILSELKALPSTLTLTASSGASWPIAATGGLAPLSYSMVSGLGSVGVSSGSYLAPSQPGSAVARVTDALGNTSSTSIQNIRFRTNGTVNSAISIGNSLYIGGSFTAVHPYEASRMIALDTTGNPISSCDLKSGFGGTAPEVRAIATTATSIYVGGIFTTYQGQSAVNIAKINLPDCTLDTTFSPPAANGFGSSGLPSVSSLAIAGNSLYVGGQFTDYRGVAVTSAIAKLDLTSGNLDTTFTSGGGFTGATSSVRTLVVANNSLYVGGNFTQYRGITNSANYLAKLDLSSGAIDTTFSPPGAGLNGFGGSQVITLAASGSSLYAGGTFTAYKGVANSAIRLAKLDLNSGAIDTTFSPVGAGLNGFSSDVNSLVASSNSLYVGGNFTAYKGVANSANRLAKLDLTTGAIDTVFSPAGATSNGFEFNVQTVALSDAVLYVGGSFANYKGIVRSAKYIAKLSPTTGIQDTTFKPQAGGNNGFNYPGPVNVISISGNTLYVGGGFTSYGGQSANNIAKLDLPDYTLDTTFSPPALNGFNSNVNTLTTSGTSLYVGGSFTDYRGVVGSAIRIAKLDLTSGAIDTTFSPVGAGLNGFVGCCVSTMVASGSSLYVGGGFTAYKGVANSANRLAKLDLTSGVIDTVFSPVGATANGYNQDVNALVVSGTSLYVGGNYTAYKGIANSANYLSKLNLTTGVIDTVFSPVGVNANGFTTIGTVFALAASGTSLYVGGSFTAYKGVANSARQLAKIDLTSGALDTTFTQAAQGMDDTVRVLAVSGTSLYVGGQFLNYRSVAIGNPAKVDLASGNPDMTFSASPGANSLVTNFTVIGTSLFMGGSFTGYRTERAAYYLVPISLTTGQNQD